MTSRPLRRAVVALGSNIEPERWVPWAIAWVPIATLVAI